MCSIEFLDSLKYILSVTIQPKHNPAKPILKMR